MKYAIAFILIVLTGCGNVASDERKTIVMDLEFEPYFKEFLIEGGGRAASAQKLAIFFGEVSEGKNAECSPLGFPTITVDRKIFEKMPEMKKRALIFHELGHCALGRLRHNDSQLADGCPASLMFHVVPLPYCLDRHWEEYMQELF